MSPLPFGFGKKPQTGSVSKEGPPLGGGLPPATEPAVNPLASPAITETVTVPETPAQIAAKKETEVPEIVRVQDELDTIFSPYMDGLESIQNKNLKEPFMVKFGRNKEEKFLGKNNDTLTSPRDSRVIVLIAPNSEGSFTLITGQGAKEIKPKTPEEAKKIQDIINQRLEYKGDTGVVGLYTNREKKTNNAAIGFFANDNNTNRGNSITFDLNTLSTLSAKEVLDRVQASRELAHAREMERQKPLEEAREQLGKQKEMVSTLLASLQEPFEPRSITPPPSAPSAPTSTPPAPTI